MILQPHHAPPHPAAPHTPMHREGGIHKRPAGKPVKHHTPKKPQPRAHHQHPQRKHQSAARGQVTLEQIAELMFLCAAPAAC